MSFTVFKGDGSGLPKKSSTQKPDQLVGDQVALKVTASGLCGTDLHYLKADIVLGHEGVGVVQDVGPEVKYIKKGDRVGWGYQTDSCGHCNECIRAEEIFCPSRHLYGGDDSAHQGSFSNGAVWREAFLHKIPDEIPDEHAAPLQCGGATVFTALQDVKPNETVAIMGVGGLGHLAIQFAAKLGCRVVVLSGSDSKKNQALELGAHKFLAMKGLNADQLKKKQKEEGIWPIDRLLVTTSAQPDWESLLPLMAPRSTIYPLSVSSGDLVIPYMPLILQGINVQGSLVAKRSVHRDMLGFAAVHGVKPMVEKFPMTEDGIAKAIDALQNGKVHYRAVLISQE